MVIRDNIIVSYEQIILYIIHTKFNYLIFKILFYYSLLKNKI